MNYREWMKNIQSSGNLCTEYCDKANTAINKKQLVDLVCDANGANFLQEMQSKGFELPYSVIHKEFSPYINGKYISEHKNDKGNGYTSCIYCGFVNDINVATTIVSLLNCTCDIRIKDNHVCRLYVDKNCKIRVSCPESSRCLIEYWEGAQVEVVGNYDRVELVENK